MRQFYKWYFATYNEEPDALLLTAEEVREGRSFLINVKRFSAATVNQRLAAMRGQVRYYGRSVNVKKVDAPIEPSNGRQIGRLLAVLEGPRWLDERNVATISVVVRAGLFASLTWLFFVQIIGVIISVYWSNVFDNEKCIEWPFKTSQL